MICCCAGSVLGQSVPVRLKAPPPNIIFIIVDDQGYGDLGAFFQNRRAKEGKPYQLSPNLDRMAAAGAMLTQHYAAAPVCAPSRASLILGVSQGHANVRDNQFDKAIDDNYTMASTLHDLGYTTAAIGKWGLQGDKRWDGEEGDQWPAKPRNRGFDYFLGYMRHSDGHEHYPKEGKYRGKKEVWNNGEEISDQLDKCYTADLWTAAAKHWIIRQEEENGKNKPFFLFLAYDTPHAVDELPTQKYPAGGGLHGGVQWLGTPGHFINTASGEIDSYVNPDYAEATYDHDQDPSTPEISWPDTYKRYATANRRIDDAVGDIRTLLKDLNIDSNTVVIYTSDNGPSIETYLGKEQQVEANHLPVFFNSFGPFDGIKRDAWEGGVRMPAIAVWPGHIRADQVIANPSISYDWAPTLIEMAGSNPPERMDGVSLLPALTGSGKQPPSLIYIEYFERGRTPGFTEFAPAHRGRLRNQMQLLRLGDYVGVRYDIKSSQDSFEIYQVVNDPKQAVNLALSPDKKVMIEGRMRPVKEVQAKMQSKVLQVRRPDPGAARPYDSSLIPSVHAATVQGVRWKFYEVKSPWLPRVTSLPARAEGRGTWTTLTDKSFSGNEGMVYVEGFLKIPEEGNYTFYLTADTRAFLRLHDMRFIDADYGYRGGTEKQASAFLQAGLHPFRLYYKANGKTKPGIDFQWSGPQIVKQPVPEEVLFSAK